MQADSSIYADQIKYLSDNGFTKAHHCIHALRKVSGNQEEALKILCEKKEKKKLRVLEKAKLLGVQAEFELLTKENDCNPKFALKALTKSDNNVDCAFQCIKARQAKIKNKPHARYTKDHATNAQ